MIRIIKKFLEHDKMVTEYNHSKELKNQMIICAIACAGSIVMSILNVLQHSWMMLCFTGISSIAMILAIIIGYVVKKSFPLKLIVSVLFFILFSYYAIIGGNQGFAALWMILAPYVLIIAVDFKLGFLAGMGYMIVLGLFFHGPLHMYLQYEYSRMFIMRFPFLYAINFAFATSIGVRLRNYQYELMSNEKELLKKQEELLRISYYDLSTNLMNRNYYKKYIHDFTGEGLNSVSVVYIDVNGLHEINNKYGHRKGDEMLCFIADSCATCYEDSNIFRIGGDEFIIIGENKTLEECKKNIDILLQKVEAEGYSISYGLCSQSENFDIRQLIGDADILMLEQKEEYHRKNPKR